MRTRKGVRLLRAPVGALVALLAPLSARAESTESGGGHVREELGTGESRSIDILELEQATVFEIFFEGERLALLLETDGVVQFIGVGAKVRVRVTGSSAGRMAARAEFALSSADRVSIWPIRRLEIRREADGFALDAQAANWAFVLSAHRTREGGLEVSCDGIDCVVRAGERLDVDREGGRMVFRQIKDAWPGKLVRMPGAVPPEEVPVVKLPPPAVRPPPRTAPLPPLPFVLTGWGAWEIRPPPPVSP